MFYEAPSFLALTRTLIIPASQGENALYEMAEKTDGVVCSVLKGEFRGQSVSKGKTLTVVIVSSHLSFN